MKTRTFDDSIIGIAVTALEPMRELLTIRSADEDDTESAEAARSLLRQLHSLLHDLDGLGTEGVVEPVLALMEGKESLIVALMKVALEDKNALAAASRTKGEAAVIELDGKDVAGGNPPAAEAHALLVASQEGDPAVSQAAVRFQRLADLFTTLYGD